MADEEDDRIMRLVKDVDELIFDQYHWPDSDDEDDLGFGSLHLRDLVYIIQKLTFSGIILTVYWGESKFRLSTLRTIADILRAHSEAEQASNSEIWKTIKPGLDLLALSSLWARLETTLCDAFIRELGLLAARSNCSLLHDRVYALLGLFPLSVSSIVTIDYNREAVEVIAEFTSAVPYWTVAAAEDKNSLSIKEG
ncbi:hypothetical protein MMC17_008310 [Xylographa soralifera]|nr:hypothetical protein [Xylographa soralifera]